MTRLEQIEGRENSQLDVDTLDTQELVSEVNDLRSDRHALVAVVRAAKLFAEQGFINTVCMDNGEINLAKVKALNDMARPLMAALAPLTSELPDEKGGAK